MTNASSAPATGQTAQTTSLGAMDAADKTRILVGALVIVCGFMLVGVIAGIAIFQFSTSTDVTAVVGSVTGVVGTVVGAFFGVHIGAAGKEQAETARRTAEHKANAFALAADPNSETTKRVAQQFGVQL